ncbi:MAG: formyltetrahydrofolate deformylase [Pseudanabaenaceae cyanobacterium SKYGB_i_bin29]|nr:formyltetrahydrofolate deformylase [Pseudanabaenaceae cyanobacterium SKYG29]MDW8421938.1 formyltetrahydrofolate deformylase [Pseudanabaenaceae cyanobacterium SKYGB_i_bin29]
MATAILLISCPDQRGLVAKISNWVFAHNGNVIDADQHVDQEAGLFLMRLEWDLTDFSLPRETIAAEFQQLAEAIGLSWQLHFSDRIPRLAIFVSKQDHCLYDLILRQKAGEINAQIPVVISNHTTLEPIAHDFNINFHHIPITPDTKLQREKEQLELLRQYQIDLVVLAKYMQILSTNFLQQFPEVINIHHSFLPAFPGANPYQRAHQRGVKIIGATAHYVTEDLDEGPIIEQDVIRVSHRDTVASLIRKGRDLERIVLARAVRLHLERRVLTYGQPEARRTVVFE